MAPRSRRHLTAWLGLIAIWLVVLAPLASQLVAATHLHDPDDAPVCSAVTPALDGGAHAHGQADPLAACGYCDLLADHIAVPAMPPVLPSLVLLLIFVVAPALSTRFTPLGAFPSGRPRAPPALS